MRHSFVHICYFNNMTEGNKYGTHTYTKSEYQYPWILRYDYFRYFVLHVLIRPSTKFIYESKASFMGSFTLD